MIVATDHHFPPNIPVDGEGECVRVLTVEFGSLDEIAKELAGRWSSTWNRCPLWLGVRHGGGEC